MRLQDFPTLIISEIASYLPLRDVVIFAQQSDALHYACEPQIRRAHRQVQLSSLEDCCHGFQILLWTLRWPGLGHYVRHVEMNTSYGGECFDIPRPADKRSLSDKDTDLLKDAIRRAGYEKAEFDEMWLQISTIPEDASTAYNSMSFTTDKEKARVTPWAQALTAMFISTSPNLESFAFAPISWMRDVTWEPRYVLKEFLANSCRHPESSCAQGLENLRRVRLLPWGQHTPGIYSAYPLSVSMKLVGYIPAVQTCWVEEVQSLDVAEVLEPSSCHFKIIRIQQSCLGFRTLVNVIRSCEELEEFEYSFGSFQTEDERSIIYGHDLLGALCSQAETLRVLDLDLGAQRTDVNNRYDGRTCGEAAGLADLSAMTHLSLNMDLLLCFARGFTGSDDDGHFSLIEQLPPQLECLTIYDYRPGMNAQWDELLEELKEMIVDGDETVFTLRGVNEYLQHPMNTETELETELEPERISEENEDEEDMGSDSDASDVSWLIAPAWYKEMRPRRRRDNH